MVNYAEDADESIRRRKYRSAAEIAQRKQERAARRSEEEWIQYARDLCYRQLGMMERSVFQLRQSMERNLVPQNIIDQTIQSFCEAGLVDDERFASMYVRSKFAEKTISRRGLQQELVRKGIAQEIISRAVKQIDSEAERDAALDFACRRIRSMASLEPLVIRRRLYGALARRGFSPDHVRYAVESALDSIVSDSANH